MNFNRKVRYGMVGGGPGGIIGSVHRKAAALDGNIELVSGAFSSSPQKSYQWGKESFLDPQRVYGSYQEMVRKESSMPEGKKIDFVSIVTPNHLHFEVAKAFIKEGINIVCEKPMVTSIEEANELYRLTDEKGIIFAVTYNYTGYPLVKQAREIIKEGVLGKVQKVVLEYSTDWFLNLTECKKKCVKEIWRTLPKKAGRSLAVGDIGSHAENLVRYITGLEIDRLMAVFNYNTPGCDLEDDSTILLNFESGVQGVLICSVVAAGEKNNLNIRVYGNKASLKWKQQEPNHLSLQFLDKPEKIYRCDSDYIQPIAANNVRLPAGHPEGYLEAFANIYKNVAIAILAREEEKSHNFEFPTIIDGVRGVYFINCAVDSAKSGKWINLDFDPEKF